MPRVTEAHREARRMQILEAAFSCFGEHGFHQTSMRDICGEAELSPGAVYQYFEGKEDLIRAIGEVSRESVQALFEQLHAGGAAPETLGDFMMHLARHVEESQDREAFAIQVRLWGEALSTPALREMMQANYDDLIERLAAIVRQGQDLDEINGSLDPEAAARMLIATYQGIVLQKAVDPDMDAWAPFEVVDALLGGRFIPRSTE